MTNEVFKYAGGGTWEAEYVAFVWYPFYMFALQHFEKMSAAGDIILFAWVEGFVGILLYMAGNRFLLGDTLNIAAETRTEKLHLDTDGVIN